MRRWREIRRLNCPRMRPEGAALLATEHQKGNAAERRRVRRGRYYLRGGESRTSARRVNEKSDLLAWMRSSSTVNEIGCCSSHNRRLPLEALEVWLKCGYRLVRQRSRLFANRG